MNNPAENRAQQTRENVEPDEGNNPIPLPMIALFAILVVWGLGYIFVDLSSYNPIPSTRDNAGVATAVVTVDSAEATTTVESSSNTAAIDAKALYAANCAACHQAGGDGLPGVFPPLQNSDWVTGDPALVTQILLHGMNGEVEVLGTTYNGVMPAFKSTFNDAEMAALINHIRSSWGNQAGDVDDAFIAEQRTAFDRSSPWQGGSELRAAIAAP